MSVSVSVCIIKQTIAYISARKRTQTHTGLFEEFSESADEEEKAIGNRWKEIKAGAGDSGFQRINDWLHQTDSEILNCRQILCERLEGIDVYCDKVSERVSGAY